MKDSRRGGCRTAFLALLGAVVGASSSAAGFSLPTSFPKVQLPSAPAGLSDLAAPVAPVVADELVEHLPPQVVDQLGIVAFKLVLGLHTVSANAEHQELVERVANRLIDQAKHGRYGAVASGFHWETKVVEGDEMNAVAFPGGKILVSEGLVTLTHGSEAHLAIALGHEIVHALARHAAQRVDKELRRELGLALTGKQLVDAKALSPAAAAGLMVAMGVVHEGAVMRPFARAQESEADHEGLLLAAGATYDPAVAIDFWQARKSYNVKPTLLQLLVAHPTDDVRIQQLQGWMPEALAIYHKTGGQQIRSASANGAPRTR